MLKRRRILIAIGLLLFALLIVFLIYFTRAADTPIILLTRTASSALMITPTLNPLDATGTAIVSNDADGDGIVDSDDLCPTEIIGGYESDAYGCPTLFDPFDSRLVFRNDLHIARYEPFWTGDCSVLTQGDRLICDVALAIFMQRVPGAPSPQWVPVSLYVLRNLEPQEQGPLRIILWDLARRAFQNWADEACRTIATEELIQLGETLRQINGSDDVETMRVVIDAITVELNEAFSRQAPC